MHLIGRNDHAAASDFVADQFGLESLTLGDKFHLRSDFAATGLFDLCHGSKTPP